MKRVTAVMGAAAMVLWASAASAQAKPDFSGSWTLDAEKTAAANPAQGGGGGGGGRAGGRGGMGGGPMTIKLDASALTVERQGRGGAQSTVYKLDGSEQTVTSQMGDAKVKATWEGNTIVIETTRQGENGAMTTKQIYSMEDGYLVVSQTLPPRGGGEATTRKSYYKKG